MAYTKKSAKAIILGLLLTACSEVDKAPLTGKVEKSDRIEVFGNSASEDSEFIFRIKGCESLTKASGFMSPEDRVRASLPEILSVERLFPIDERHEGRTAREGLDRWYVAKLSTPMVSKEIVRQLSISGTVDVVEFTSGLGIRSSEAYGTPGTKTNYAEAVVRSSSFPFNESIESAARQWHYNNTGSVEGKPSLYGADADVWAAWELCQGNREVIVAVIDQGVMYEHEDLAENMWINQAERDGRAGVDDDGNGYVDDIYGYDFVSNDSRIVWSEELTHATHVAGTIAAVNNNSVGVNGIAGGSGNGNGVRIMTLQTIGTLADPLASAGIVGTVRAIKYAADNGAVICQNSWSYDNSMTHSAWLNSEFSSVKEAMKYFAKYAGTDDEGNQSGPMKGGIMIFSSGNEDTFMPEYPAADDLAISVSAIAYDGSRAYYSNYGSTVDIAAPGGDITSDMAGGIYSTMVGEGGCSSYGYLQGTSMACPHVSGACALAVSYYYGQDRKMGLTAEKLREALLSSAADIDINMPEGYRGQMGRGALDTYAFLRYVDPEKDYLKDIEDQQLDKGKELSLDLARYFYSTAALTVQIDDRNIADAGICRGVLTLKGKASGTTEISVSDAASTTRTFNVTVR